MKQIFTPIMLLLTMTFFGNACVEKVIDPCKDLNCGSHGFCDALSKTCDCDEGWEGAKCDIMTRTRFMGNYNVSENCAGTMNSYTCIVAGGFLDKDITINPIKGATIKATVDANNTINVNTLGAGSYSTITGTGNLNGNTITLNLSFNPISGSDFNCSFTLTK